jgi:FtsZ-binding cell division protein ZapB
MRRDRLNDRFLELSAALEPGRPPKTDKATILSDAVRILTQLRAEAQGLTESNNQLRETIKDLKNEKNELREEKTRLKADKERLEQQVKSISIPTGYMPHPAAMHAAAAAFAAQTQAASTKAAQMAAYPGMAMWQWMPPAAVDTSQDHVLRPPVA